MSVTSLLKMKGVRNTLLLFGIFGVIGILLLVEKLIVLGLVVLVVAQIFYLMAYRRFKSSSSAPSQDPPSSVAG